ncbi:hypothetical protein CONCODRAFT_166458, partial [Conidiobolus coronatus NRRL 28638]
KNKFTFNSELFNEKEIKFEGNHIISIIFKDREAFKFGDSDIDLKIKDGNIINIDCLEEMDLDLEFLKIYPGECETDNYEVKINIRSRMLHPVYIQYVDQNFLKQVKEGSPHLGSNTHTVFISMEMNLHRLVAIRKNNPKIENEINHVLACQMVVYQYVAITLGIPPCLPHEIKEESFSAGGDGMLLFSAVVVKNRPIQNTVNLMIADYITNHYNHRKMDHLIEDISKNKDIDKLKQMGANFFAEMGGLSSDKIDEGRSIFMRYQLSHICLQIMKRLSNLTENEFNNKVKEFEPIYNMAKSHVPVQMNFPTIETFESNPKCCIIH